MTQGTWWISVDSFTAKGAALAGDYTLRVGFIQPSKGPCGMQTGVMKRVKDQGKHLPMPAKGPIVKEAHLVTQEEPAPFPATATSASGRSTCRRCGSAWPRTARCLSGRGSARTRSLPQPSRPADGAGRDAGGPRVARPLRRTGRDLQ